MPSSQAFFARFVLYLWLCALFSSRPVTSGSSSEDDDVQDAYDFVIIGGGTAGLVVANRLSEAANQTVLVLEAGPRPEIVRSYQYPGSASLSGTLIDWDFSTTPQAHLGGRILPYHRGRGLGGSSAINGIWYGRGSASVYDRWASLGNPGWGWDDVYPYFKKSTSFHAPDPAAGFDDRYKTFEPSAYGDGPLQIGFQGFVRDSSVAFMEALAAVDVPIVQELNAGNNTGVRQGTATLDRRYRRSSSYDSFYRQAAARSNLKVRYNAQAQVLLPSPQGDGVAISGAVYIDQNTGLIRTVTARKEVILSAGAFQSPQLLMVSGIGPASVLKDAGVTPVHVNENIGQHLVDHPVFSLVASVQPASSFVQDFANLTLVRREQAAFFANASGLFTGGPGLTNGFRRLSAAALEQLGAGAVVAAGLANQSQLEYSYEGGFYPAVPSDFFTAQADGSYVSLTSSNMVPLSRGNVSIASGAISDSPIINPNYYDDPADARLAVYAFRSLRQVLAHPGFAVLTVGADGGEVAPGAAVQSDAQILAYLRRTTSPNWHAAGTLRMLPEAKGGVVDARLRVHGVRGLRVVDCSVIPLLPDANIQAAVYMIGEKGADLVKEDWGLL